MERAEVTARALDRCRTDGSVVARASTRSHRLRVADAQAADRRRRQRKSHGLLDGVPVFAKAIYDMNGLPTTASNAEWARLFPDPVRRDAIEIARLRAAGAIVLGKTAADDFAYRGVGTSSHTGQVRNPYDATGTRTPGGSSAGSAVAVAGGMAFGALGTDDGGSNRIPAVCTGIVGMKPTFGLVPRTGVIPTWPYLDTHGPLARSVADAALLLAVIAGVDASDPLSAGRAPDGKALAALRDDSLKGVRLGLVEAHVPREKMTTEALAIWDRAVADLRNAGAIVELFVPPSPSQTTVGRSPTPSTREVMYQAILVRRPRPQTRCIATSPAAPTTRSTRSAAGTARTDPFTMYCRSDSKSACRCSIGRWRAIRPGSRSPTPARRWWPRSADPCAPPASPLWCIPRCRSTRFVSPTDGPTSGRRSATATGSACRRSRSLPASAPMACLR